VNKKHSHDYMFCCWFEFQISEATLFDDSLILAMGFVIMFCYVGLMLGRFNMIEQRVS